MIKKLSPKVIHKLIKERLEASNIGVNVYSIVPKDAEAPLLYIEYVGKKPEDTRLYKCERYEYYIHAITEEERMVTIYELIKAVEDSMINDFDLPQGFKLLEQVEEGVLEILEDETNEKHAIIGFSFKVAYSFRTK